MDWLSTPVTVPAGLIVLSFSVFGTALGTLIGVIFKLLSRFFSQQDMVMKALSVSEKSTELAQKTVSEK